MANLAFSLAAAAGSLAVAILAAGKGVWIVAAIWGLLFVGFLVRASEIRRRGHDR